MATGITYKHYSRCKLPGCNNARYMERNGFRHEFCGRTHAEIYSAAFGVKPTPSTYTGSAKSVSSNKPKPMKAEHSLLQSLPSSLPSTSRFGLSSIKFYNRDEPYYEFTNFYWAQVFIDGQHWPSTEHYFQAQKFVGTPYLNMIRNCLSAREAFQLSRNPTVSQWRRSDWDSVKDGIMLKALRCKFAQHRDLRKMLWETGGKELIEHTKNDCYWADGGGHGMGQNKLGKLLMKVRDDIVAVLGPYVKPAKEPSKSSNRVSWGPPLKRSSSTSDLSRLTTSKKASPSPKPLRNNEFLTYQFCSTTLGTPKTKLKRSSSISSFSSSYISSCNTSSSRSQSYAPSSHSHERPDFRGTRPSTITDFSRSSQPSKAKIKSSLRNMFCSSSKNKKVVPDPAKVTQIGRSSSPTSHSSTITSQPWSKQSRLTTEQKHIQPSPTSDKNSSRRSRGASDETYTSSSASYRSTSRIL